MTAFKYFSVAVWLSFCINAYLAVPSYILPTFEANLTTGYTSISSLSSISWVRNLTNPGFGPCDMRGIIRLPLFGSCHTFLLEFNSNPTGFNFHIANGCGDGWGGSSGCYEVHNYKKTFYVYGKTGSGDGTRLTNVIGKQIVVTIQKGNVYFGSNDITQTVYNPTLFTSSYVYFSMNRVYNLNAFPNPPRVGTGLCHVFIFRC